MCVYKEEKKRNSEQKRFKFQHFVWKKRWVHLGKPVSGLSRARLSSLIKTGPLPGLVQMK